ncbi:MAG: hypothetical protein ACE5F9_07865 [Phycisphaerae bacterium]
MDERGTGQLYGYVAHKGRRYGVRATMGRASGDEEVRRRTPA